MQFTIIRDRNGLNTNAVLTIGADHFVQIDAGTVGIRKHQLALLVDSGGLNAYAVFTIYAIGTILTVHTVFTVCAVGTVFTICTVFTIGAVLAVHTVYAVFAVLAICTICAVFTVFAVGAVLTVRTGHLTYIDTGTVRQDDHQIAAVVKLGGRNTGLLLLAVGLDGLHPFFFRALIAILYRNIIGGLAL